MQKYLFLIMGLLGLLGCKSDRELPTVSELDLHKYMGTWHEIARLPNSFEKGLDCTTATYSIRDDGKVEVVNRGRKVSKGDEYSEAKGKAWLPNPDVPGELKVSFFWPFAGDYFVMEIDANYNHVLVGSPNRKYLWILAREKTMQPEVYKLLVNVAKRHGFDVSKLEKINQNCN